jgi:hypothetical protein
VSVLNSTGLTGKGGNLVSFTQSLAAVPKIYVLKPGDFMSVDFERDDDFVGDLCGPVGVWGIEIQYKVKAEKTK